jgi:5'(3')-deoxyribonucleotidase
MEVRIYIDLDGTVCDLKGAVTKYREKNSEHPGDIHYKYPWSVHGFFLDLDPLPLAIESVNFLKENYDVWFLSRPSFKNTNSYTEKAEWVKKHFGYEMQKKLILCGDKSLLKGKVLIDDAQNANQDNFSGIWLRIGSEQYPGWESIMKRIQEISELEINSL